MQIRALKLEGNVFLAPMAGYTSWPMRLLCRKMGAALVFSEMISANSLVFSKGRGRKITEKLMEIHPDEHPLAIQIFGADPEIMAEAAVVAESLGPDLIDLNLGCSVKKVLKSGAGAALLKDPKKAGALFRSVRKSVRVPLSIKIRAGWDESSINAPEIACLAEGEGVDAVTLHARTARMSLSQPADWSIIARTVSAVKIPVIGNGDIRVSEDVTRMQKETGCAAVMIGRAARGAPWVFRDAVRDGSSAYSPSAGERHEVVAQHYRFLLEHQGDHLATAQMRKHVAWYSRGQPDASVFRDRINRARIPDEMWALIHEYFGERSFMEDRDHA